MFATPFLWWHQLNFSKSGTFKKVRRIAYWVIFNKDEATLFFIIVSPDFKTLDPSALQCSNSSIEEVLLGLEPVINSCLQVVVVTKTLSTNVGLLDTEQMEAVDGKIGTVGCVSQLKPIWLLATGKLAKRRTHQWCWTFRLNYRSGGDLLDSHKTDAITLPAEGPKLHWWYYIKALHPLHRGDLALRSQWCIQVSFPVTNRRWKSPGFLL